MTQCATYYVGSSLLNILTTECYVVNIDSKLFHLVTIAGSVHPSKKATNWNLALVSRQRLTTPALVFGWVRNVAEEPSCWFKAAPTSLRRGGSIGFERRDVLLNIYLERCLIFRKLHSNSSDFNVRSLTWINRERWEIEMSLAARCITFVHISRANVKLSIENKSSGGRDYARIGKDC